MTHPFSDDNLFLNNMFQLYREVQSYADYCIGGGWRNGSACLS